MGMVRRRGQHGPGAERDPFGIQVDDALGMDRPDARRGETPPWALAAVAVGALALLWLVTSVTGSDDATVTTQSPTPAGDELVVPSPRPTLAPTPTPTPTPTPQPTPLSFFEAREADTARAQLATAAAGHTVVYLSEDGVGRLDLDTGLAPPLRAEVSNLARFGGGELLRGGDGNVYAVRADDLDVVQIVASDQLAVVTGPSSIALASGPDAALVSIVEVVDQVPDWATVPVPAGVEVAAVDGLGIVGYEDGVGSWMATAQGLVLLTDARIVAASAAAWLEQRCQDDDCSLRLVSRIDATAHELPGSFVMADDRWSVAPDGSGVLRIAPDGSAELYTPADGGLAWVTGAGMVEAAWAPDSSFIAWIDTEQPDPRLKVMRPDRRDWVVVDLGVLGAAAPVEPGLLVLATG